MLIDSNASLKEVVGVCLKQTAVALDTEFFWERTYYPKLGLIQIGLQDETTWLVDVPRISDFSPLAELLNHDGVTKVLHDALQDLVILHRCTGGKPRRIFDTRLASGFVGFGSTLSLRDVINKTLGIDIPKDQTRSDWLKRPLSDKQIAYARDDVRYLVRVSDLLQAKITASGRDHWLKEEMLTYEQSANFEQVDALDLMQKIKGRGRVKYQDLGLLSRLALHRDQLAQKLDRPRSHVISDEALVDMAVHKPSTLDQLRRIEGASDRVLARDGENLLALINSKNVDVDDLKIKATSESEGQSACVDFLMACIKGCALNENIDPALVATRAQVSEAVRFRSRSQDHPQRLFSGWRNEFIGEDIQKILKGEISARIDPQLKLPILLKREA